MMTLILSVFLFIGQSADMSQTISLFNEGNQAYQAGNYLQAVEKYQAAVNLGYESPELYYNLGNAYYKTGHLGKSILNYERAKKLFPNAPDVNFNLDLAQLRVVDKIIIPEPFFLLKVWNTIKFMFSLQTLAVIGLFLYILFIGIIIVRMLAKRMYLQNFSKYAFVPVFVFFLIFASLFFIRLNHEHKNKEAIVVVEKVQVKSSPSLDATDVFSLHEGAKVKISEQSGSFQRIELPDGKVGWLTMESIERI